MSHMGHWPHGSWPPMPYLHPGMFPAPPPAPVPPVPASQTSGRSDYSAGAPGGSSVVGRHDTASI
eukprot:11121469-Karenia_brevis.AAC.1